MFIFVKTVKPIACVKSFFPHFLSPDQREPENFCHLRQWPCFLALTDRTHTLWHQSEKTDHSKQTPTKAVRSWDCSGAKPLALCDHVFICKISPHKEKSVHITVCKKCVASEQSETLQSPPTVCGNCLVPKLNWRMHCNSSFYCLSFFSIYYVMEF